MFGLFGKRGTSPPVSLDAHRSRTVVDALGKDCSVRELRERGPLRFEIFFDIGRKTSRHRQGLALARITLLLRRGESAQARIVSVGERPDNPLRVEIAVEPSASDLSDGEIRAVRVLAHGTRGEVVREIGNRRYRGAPRPASA